MGWNNINEDRDTICLGPIEYDQSKVPSLIRKHADNVRGKSYGQQVREAQARNAEYAGLIASEAINKASNADLLSRDTLARFEDQISGSTDINELLDARRNNKGFTFKTLKSRLDAVEDRVSILQFGAVADGLTDISDALEEAVAEGHRKIYFPNGNYVWKRPLKITNPVYLIGENRDKTIITYEPDLDSTQTGLDVRAFNGRNYIFEMENFTVDSKSKLAEQVISSGRSKDGVNLEWGNRSRVNNVEFVNYENYGLRLVAPYEVDIDHSTFEVPKGEKVNNDYSPRNNAVGLLLTGKAENLNTMGNVVRINNSYFTNNKYGIEMINMQRVEVDAVFEHNWITAYMHSQSDTFNTSGVVFKKSWLEDTSGGHPELYLVDCYIDEQTGQYDVTREVATGIKLENTYVHPVKPVGLPASKGVNQVGRTYSQDDATNNYFIRQWDSLEDVDDKLVPHDGVVTQIGGNDNYFRGKIKTAGGLITQPFGTPLRREVDGKHEYLDYFRNNFTSKLNQTEQVVVHKRNSLHFPTEIPSGKVVTRVYKITAYLVMQEYNISVLQSVYGSIGPNSVDAQTILASNPNDMLRKKDVNNPEDNNNLGIRVSENDDYLLIWFSGVGLRGVQYMIESTYYIHDGTYGF